MTSLYVYIMHFDHIHTCNLTWEVLRFNANVQSEQMMEQNMTSLRTAKVT